MITRFYVDNYKCLQNFEYTPKPFELIVGANGTGKSTVFEALDKVRRFVTGEADARELFNLDCSTRWSIRMQQVFELDYKYGSDNFQYHLEIKLSSIFRVEKELLMRNAEVLYETEWVKTDAASADVAFWPDDLGDSDPLNHFGQNRLLLSPQGVKAPLADPNKSAFVNRGPRLTSLKQALSQIHYFKLNPALMTSQVGKVAPRPANDLSNFASYYLYLLQQKQGKMFEMIPHLREAINDFDSFAVEEDFEEARRNLRIVCQSPTAKKGTADSLRYGFEELSDGQRALIALYTLLFCTLEPNSTLIIDEPENYIALRELQPWLMLLQERLEEYGGQVILISHHPEFINALAPGNTVVFERENAGPVRIKPFDSKLVSSLSPAEIVARGWEHE